MNLDPTIVRRALDKGILTIDEVTQLALAYLNAKEEAEKIREDYITFQADIGDLIPPLPGGRANDPMINRVKWLSQNVCVVCGGRLLPGVAFAPTAIAHPDFPGDTGQEHGCTISQGPGVLTTCRKCESCGHSVTVPKS